MYKEMIQLPEPGERQGIMEIYIEPARVRPRSRTVEGKERYFKEGAQVINALWIVLRTMEVEDWSRAVSL
jgi:hypothetical protein